MRCMVFAAGLGTRLKPMTDVMPKALVKVAGESLLDILIRRLHKAGFDSAVINIHHFAGQMRDWLSSYSGPMDISLSDESQMLLETGGGLKHARGLLGSEPFLVHNVDILHNVDLGKFFRENQDKGEAVLMVSERKTNRYFLFDEEMRLVGWTNISTGEVRSPFENLDVEKCRMLAFSGIHIFSPTLFDEMDAFDNKFPIVDFYLSVAKRRRIVGVEMKSYEMLDVGKLDSIKAAETFLEKYPV